MPRKLSPEEATVMIIRRRLQQMEEAKIAEHEAENEDEQDDLSEQDSDEKSAGEKSAK
jgi:hypothetical protein